MSKPLLRPYVPADAPALAALYHRTVHTVCRADYSPEEVAAWSPAPPDAAVWNPTFLAHHTLVAEVDGCIAGFADMAEDGYLDRLYVSADHQRMGVATALCDALEAACTAPALTTYASLTAKGFFLRRGYEVVCAQQVERRGVLLTNFVMRKLRPLPDPKEDAPC